MSLILAFKMSLCQNKIDNIASICFRKVALSKYKALSHYVAFSITGKFIHKYVHAQVRSSTSACFSGEVGNMRRREGADLLFLASSGKVGWEQSPRAL